MPRQARQKSKSGIYHVILRGINQQSLFEDDEDREKFLSMLKRYQEKGDYAVYAYCLMDNHIHLLIKEGDEALENTMKRIGVGYVYWYNWKKERCGHLFQDRYKSEPVEDDQYLLTVLRYIHQNPLKAGMTKAMGEYPWSSYQEYLRTPRIIDSLFILKMFSEDERKAKEHFIAYMKDCGEEALDVNDNKKLTDREARKIIVRETGGLLPGELQQISKDERDKMIRELKEIKGLSIRQIARVTGLTVNVIARA